MFYIEYAWNHEQKINCNYNTEKKYLEALKHFQKQGKKIISHGKRPVFPTKIALSALHKR